MENSKWGWWKVWRYNRLQAAVARRREKALRRIQRCEISIARNEAILEHWRGRTRGSSGGLPQDIVEMLCDCRADIAGARVVIAQLKKEYGIV